MFSRAEAHDNVQLFQCFEAKTKTFKPFLKDTNTLNVWNDNNYGPSLEYICK